MMMHNKKSGLANLVAGAALFTSGCLFSAVQAAGPLTAAITLDKQSYAISEPIIVTPRLVNGTANELLVTDGVSDSSLSSYLRVTRLPDGPQFGPDDPEEEIVTTGPTPRVLYDTSLTTPLQVAAVERFAAGEEKLTDPFNLKDLYTLPGPACYKVQLQRPYTSYAPPTQTLDQQEYADYSAILFPINGEDGTALSNVAYFCISEDVDGDGYTAPEDVSTVVTGVDCDDDNPAVNPGASEVLDNGIDENCDGVVEYSPVPPPAIINIQADEHRIGSGNFPAVTTATIQGIEIRAYDKAAPCVQQYDVSHWKHRRPLVRECTSSKVLFTDENGLATFQLVAGDWLFIGVYPPGSPASGSNTPPGSPNDGSLIVYGATGVDGAMSGAEYNTLIKFIYNTSSGKPNPASYKKRSGSVLLIVQPDYIEWDGTEALYPIVFDSVGDWTVVTSVAPPEGFVADQEALTAEVVNEVEAVQFTITDIGSDWVSTGVTYEVKHKGKSEKIHSKIGVMLSDKLAKAKGMSRFGDEPPPPIRRGKMRHTPVKPVVITQPPGLDNKPQGSNAENKPDNAANKP